MKYNTINNNIDWFDYNNIFNNNITWFDCDECWTAFLAFPSSPFKINTFNNNIIDFNMILLKLLLLRFQIPVYE